MRRRLVVVALGAGVALGGLPALAAPPTQASVRPEQQARALLETAARAGRSLAYTGTQYLATWRDGDSAAALVEVAHDPDRGSLLTPAQSPEDVPMTATATLDDRLLDLLAASYDLVVAAPGRCTGRTADVVEANRPDGTVAGRFWVDRESGLLLRREVFDADGQRMRSSAFLDLLVDEGSGAVEPLEKARAQVPSAASLREEGWRVPAALPEGFRLFDTRLSEPAPGEQVLHLAYSDGLSTVSLFAQRGRLGSEPLDGFVAEQVGERPVWVRHEAPERVVWSGDGRVWTLVSDAPSDTVRAAVEALPRDRAPSDGLLARLGRGLARIASMLNPFD